MRGTLSRIIALKGHGFSRAANVLISNVALATEGMLVIEDAFPQGLKPRSSIAKFLTRLKPCPFKTVAFSDTESLSAIQILCAVVFFFATAAIGALGQTLPAATGYRIAGTVVNAVTGEPLRRTTVAVLSEPDSHTVESVETDNEGRFALEGLAAGKYPLTASKRGFLTAFYDQHDGGYNTAIVTGPGQETGGLVFRLVPGAVLHGVVTGDGGDPVEGARVMLFVKPRNHNPGAKIAQAGEAATDDTGAYEFDDLAASEYLLAVKAEPWYALHRSAAQDRQRPQNDSAAALDVAYPATFFDSTTDESSATQIHLTGGSREEADINLHAVPALHLTVESPIQEDGTASTTELRQSIFGTEVYRAAVGSRIRRQTGTGEIEFTGVAPGQYELTQSDPPRIVEVDATTSQQIDPSLGMPTVIVSGRLWATAGALFPENLSVHLSPLNAAQSQTPLQTACANGSFSFTGVPPGSWKLTADSPGKTLSVSSISVGAKTQAGNLFAVEDKPVQIEATVSLGDTRVEGFARKNERGLAGAMVVLVPRNPAANADQFRRDQSDSDGSFSLHDVPPGEYTVVAIEDGWELDWARPEVIGRYLPKGVAVTVAGSSGKLLRLAEGVPVQDH